MAGIEPHLDMQGGHQVKLTALEGPASRSRMESKQPGLMSCGRWTLSDRRA